MASIGMGADDQQAMKAFEADVIQPSMEKLVILQFTADWCGPCQQLSPLLDQMAADYADQNVVLKRIDIDKDKFIAAQFRIQSVPTVYAMFQGQPVADLTPYRTPGALKQALDQLVAQLPIGGAEGDKAADIEPHLQTGEQILAEGDYERARILYDQLKDMDPANPRIIGGMAQALIGLGDVDAATMLLDACDAEQEKHPAIAKAKAQIKIAASGEEAVDTRAYEARLEAEPDDHDARMKLAEAQMVKGQRDPAADNLLHIIAADRDYGDGAAREKFLALLEASGLADDWSKAQRRRLSAVLFT